VPPFVALRAVAGRRDMSEIHANPEPNSLALADRGPHVEGCSAIST
jgi:hypothetical protein